MVQGLASTEEVAGVLAQAIVNGVWQGVLLTAAVAAGVACLRRGSAATRHLIWTATLLTVAVLPAADLVRAARWSGAGVAAPAMHPGGGEAAGVRHPSHPPVSAAPVAAAPGLAAGAVPERRRASGVAWQISVPSGAWLVPLLGGVAALAALRLSGIALGLWRLRRWRREARPLPHALRTGLEPLCARHAGGAVALLVSDRVATPVTAGLLRPAVLLPESLLGALREEELVRITLHELAHVRRLDPWTNLAQRVVEAVFFFHPAVRWIGRRLELEREIACDDYVVAAVAGERAYARCLTRLAELAAGSRPARLAPGIAPRGSQLARRVQSLLAPQRPARVGVSAAAALGAGFGLLAGSAALLHFAPAVRLHAAVPAPAHADPSAPQATPLRPRRTSATGGAAERRSPLPAPEAPARAGAALPGSDMPPNPAPVERVRGTPVSQPVGAAFAPLALTLEPGPGSGGGGPAEQHPAPEEDALSDCTDPAGSAGCAPGGDAAEGEPAFPDAPGEPEPETSDPADQTGTRPPPPVRDRGRGGVRIPAGVPFPMGPRTGPIRGFPRPVPPERPPRWP